MSGFVRLPGLPKAAEAVIIGEKYAEILQNSFEIREISTILVPNDPCVDPRLSGHADLSVFHAGGERLFLAPYLKRTAFHNRLAELGAELVFPEIVQRPDYPRDAQLNACVVGKRLICSPKVTANEIVDFFTNEANTESISVRQGYVNCSVCVVDEGSLITADRGIARAAEQHGSDVLLISSGSIDLPGFACGFIGGAAFRLSEHTMAFTGVLDRHPDKEAILSFLDRHGLEADYLTNRPIFDIGGAIPLIEKT